MKVNNFTQNVLKKPLKQRLRDTQFLIRHSFTTIGRDKDIKTPMIRMAVVTSLLRMVFLLSLLPVITANSHQNVILIALSVLCWFLLITILVPFRFFYDVRQKGNLSWIVYNTLCGTDISYRDAKGHTKTQKGKLRALGFGELVLVFSRTFKKDSGILISLFLGALTEVWDLLSNFMLPSVVIEQKKLKEIAPEIKSLKANVPATLTGVFGLDFAGDAIKTLLLGMSAFLLILSIMVGWLLAFVTDAGVMSFGETQGFAFSWIPVYAAFFLATILFGVIRKFIESIKVIYFTVFYTSIKQPGKIVESLRDDLTSYLRLDEETPGD